jgi:hypothetical protein
VAPLILEVRMTMLRLNAAQRAVLTDKFPDFANAAVAALVFGQAFSDDPFSTALALLGLAIWIVFVMLAVIVAGKENAT